MLHRKRVERVHIFGAAVERRTKIGEWQRDPAASGERARNLHYRQRLPQLLAGVAANVNRLMPVSIAQHARPAGSVKKSRIRKRRQLLIPVRLLERVDDY